MYALLSSYGQQNKIFMNEFKRSGNVSWLKYIQYVSWLCMITMANKSVIHILMTDDPQQH